MSDREQEITNALNKVTTGRAIKAYFTEGHGEKSSTGVERTGVDFRARLDVLKGQLHISIPQPQIKLPSRHPHQVITPPPRALTPHGPIVPDLVAVIQQQQRRIEALEKALAR